MFKAETWVLTLRMDRAQDSFKHRVTRRLNWEATEETGDGSCTYLILEEAMGEAGFEGIRKYVTKRYNTVALYISMRPIRDL